MINTLVVRARQLEAAVYKAAEKLAPHLAVTEPYAEALRLSAKRLVPSVWEWRVEACYGGSAVFFITNYTGE